MDRGQSEKILIEHRSPGQIAGGVGRIERQLREEALAGRILPRQQLELIEIPQARVEVLIDALELGAVPVACHV